MNTVFIHLLVVMSNIAKSNGAAAPQCLARDLGSVDRLRKVTAFCLKRRGIPAPAVEAVVAERHPIQNDRGIQNDRSFFPVNEWKYLGCDDPERSVFKRTERTERLFEILDQYESTIAAFKGGNDGPSIERENLATSVELLSGDSRERDFASVVIEDDGHISGLIVYGLEDEDINNLSYLPTHLKFMNLSYGKLTNDKFKHSDLPRGLVTLHLFGNQITKFSIDFSRLALRRVNLGNNPLERHGVELSPPLPVGFHLSVPEIELVNLNGGVLQESSFAREWSVTWSDGGDFREKDTRIKISCQKAQK